MAFDWLTWDNFKLGVAGTVDAVTGLPAEAARSIGADDAAALLGYEYQTHLSGGVYETQSAKNPAESDSQHYQDLRAAGRDDEAAQLLHETTTEVIDTGGLYQAAETTAQQVASSTKTLAIAAAVVAALGGTAYLVWRLS